MKKITQLLPPIYRPYRFGRYIHRNGLYPLGHNFGNEHFDNKVLHLHGSFNYYRNNKLKYLKQNPHRYLANQLTDEQLNIISQKLLDLFIKEYPYLIDIKNGENATLYTFLHTQDQLELTQNRKLISFKIHSCPTTSTLNILDFLSLQWAEDLLICHVPQNPKDNKILYGSLFSPNHWSLEEKMGKNFAQVHDNVAEMEQILKSSLKLLSTLTLKGPFVRFAWGLATEQVLNQHPLKVREENDFARTFENSHKIFTRVERQVTYPFPEITCFAFFIKTYFENIELIKENLDDYHNLIKSLKSMSMAVKKYKGLTKLNLDKL